MAQLASHRGHDHHSTTVSGFSTCRVGAMQVSSATQEVRMELDSHADTCVVGEGTALIMHNF